MPFDRYSHFARPNIWSSSSRYIGILFGPHPLGEYDSIRPLPPHLPPPAPMGQYRVYDISQRRQLDIRYGELHEKQLPGQVAQYI